MDEMLEVLRYLVSYAEVRTSEEDVSIEEEAKGNFLDICSRKLGTNEL